MQTQYKEIWQKLPEHVRQSFESHAVILKFKRGDFVYQQGEKPKGIYFIKEGLVGLTKLGLTGKEHLLRFFRQGQFFGHRALFSQEEYHGNTVALQPTEIKLVASDIVLQALEKEPHLLFDVVRVLARELRRSENQHVLILDHQINVRVAQALIYLKDLHPDHHWTRQEIANFCASTVSTVIKSMAQLEEMNLIEQRGREIKIIDRDKLLSLQEEESH